MKLSCQPLPFTLYKIFLKKQKGLELISLPHFLHDFWTKIFVALYSINWPNLLDFMPFLREIVHKKTDEWYIEWQQVTTNDIEWYNKWQRMTMSDSEWYNEWQRMTTSGTMSDKEWQRMTKSDKKWQWVTASVSSGTANENGTIHFTEWMIAMISMTKRDTLLLQGMADCN